MNIIQRYDTMNDYSPIEELLELVDRKSKLFLSTHLGCSARIVGRTGNPLTPAMREQLRTRVQAEVLGCTRHDTRARRLLLERIAQEFNVHYSTVVKHTVDIRNMECGSEQKQAGIGAGR